MIPKVLCQKCGSQLEADDAFCGSCGEKVEWGGAEKTLRKVPEPTKRAGSSLICRLCGQANEAEAASCEGCGAALTGGSGVKGGDRGKGNAGQSKPSPGRPLTFLQSWKLTAALGVLLVASLIFIKVTNKRESPEPPGMPPEHEGIVKEIQALKDDAERDPKNADAKLKLGNIYYDQRMFPQAITMYEQYLDLNASDPNARVDLGVSYFELALQDSTHRASYFATAKKEMEQAIRYAPKHQLAFFNLGMVNLHTGDVDKATEWFSKCWSIDSTSETGKRAKQLISKHTTSVPSL